MRYPRSSSVFPRQCSCRVAGVPEETRKNAHFVSECADAACRGRCREATLWNEYHSFRSHSLRTPNNSPFIAPKMRCSFSRIVLDERMACWFAHCYGHLQNSHTFSSNVTSGGTGSLVSHSEGFRCARCPILPRLMLRTNWGARNLSMSSACVS